eukprot:tig00000865_g5099.t1
MPPQVPSSLGSISALGGAGEGRKSKRRSCGGFNLEERIYERPDGDGVREIRKAKHQVTGQAAVAKIATKAAAGPLVREHAILSGLDHPGVVKTITQIEQPARVVTFLEYAEGGSLAGVLDGKLGEGHARRLFVQLVHALVYCHSQGVAHRDVRASNCLLSMPPGSQVPILKLCDFEAAERVPARGELLAPPLPVSRLAPNAPRPMSALAPEAASGGHIVLRPADIWAAGALLFELVCGYSPLPELAAGERLYVPEFLSSRCRRLLKSMLHWDPLERPNAAALAAHPWVADSDPRPLPVADAGRAAEERARERERRRSMSALPSLAPPPVLAVTQPSGVVVVGQAEAAPAFASLRRSLPLARPSPEPSEPDLLSNRRRSMPLFEQPPGPAGSAGVRGARPRARSAESPKLLPRPLPSQLPPLEVDAPRLPEPWPAPAPDRERPSRLVLAPLEGPRPGTPRAF